MIDIKIKFFSILLMILVIFILISLFAVYKTSKLRIERTEFVENETKSFKETGNIFFDYDIVRYPSNVEVLESEPDNINMSIGMNNDPWGIFFGVLPQSSSSIKIVNLTNDNNENYRIEFLSFGNISNLIALDSNEFIIKPKQRLEVKIYVKTDFTTIPGKYNGEIDIITYIPKNLFAKKIQRWL